MPGIPSNFCVIRLPFLQLLIEPVIILAVLFDLEFPAGYTGNKDEMLAAMCQFVHEQDPKYSCVVKVEQSYASAAHEK